MDKQELKSNLESRGYTVSPVGEWTQTAEVDGVVKYDVEVIEPDDNFAVRQVKVKNDSQADEEASPVGAIKQKEPTFSQDVRNFLRTQESQLPDIFALAIEQIFNEDEVVEVKAYLADNSTQKYVVKRRGGSFDFQKFS